MFFLIQLLSLLARLWEALYFLMWVALVIVPLWFLEKAVLAAASAAARAERSCNTDVEENDMDVKA